MGNIALLDELTISKIAAGEVIERPASVIKEMVENSIDAKATNITIEIKNGGISYIKIIDNGKGIAKDDFDMAFERHATSKIRHAEDITNVTSMGFRGEALASIAAIANVELVSKTEEQETGYKMIVEGGKILEKEEIGCQTGTTITVQNLFFNTPVRYKFLKKDYTETGYIEDVVEKIALVNPEISFKLINDGKTILQTSGNGDLKSVIYSIYGKDIAQGIIEVNYDYDDIKISGVIGNPEIARSNRSNQIFFVNKRYIKDKILTAATEQAYKGLIDGGKFAFVVLNLQMSPSKVDVNVHPSKLEVRFQEESKIFQAIFHTIKDTLARNRAQLDTSVKVDNIIIQSSNNESDIKAETKEPIIEEKNKVGGFFSWRKNKKNFGYENNIVEDLYNQKKMDEQNDVPKIFKESETKQENEEKNVEVQNQNEEDAVNTSDVLKELKQINENVQKDIQEETAKKQVKTEENNVSEIENKDKELPDGLTYTYVGENKEKIESLLRQLHPEVNKNNEIEETLENGNEEKEVLENNEQMVAENLETYQLEQKSENLDQDIDLVKEIEQMDESKDEDIEVNNETNLEQESEKSPDLEETQKIEQVNDVEKTQKIEIVKDDNKNNEFNKMYEKLFGTSVIQEKTEEETKQDEQLNAVDIIQDNVSVFDSIDKYKKPVYKFTGIVFNFYIIAEIEKDMYIINQRTAKEKIMYEKLKSNYYSQMNKDFQMLLLPDIIELNNKQIEIIKENYDIITKAGFILEEFGSNTIRLTGVPTICIDLDTKELFIEILEEINTVARTSKKEKEEKFLSTIASKIAQKADLAVSIQEVNTLMEQLLSLNDPFTYDFEKPIAIKMTKYDIERKFSRK